MASPSTDTFFFQHAASAVAASFPRELRSRPLSQLEPRFTLLFFGSFIFFGGIVFLLSFRKVSDTVSEKQILKIQERYASIVLNQPKPKAIEEQKVKEVKTTAAKEEGGGQKKEGAKVDRDKESYTEKQERKAGTRVEREAVREKVRQQVQSSGIFAAITAVGGGSSVAGGGPSSSSVQDLLGVASESIGDIGNLKVSKGTFATKNVDVAEVKARRGQITSGVDIARESVGKATGGRISSGGSVNITSAPPEVTGEAASLASRSQASIKRQIDLEANRLKRVYENWLKRDPSLAGQLKIKFTILPSGEVENVSVVNSTTNNAEFDENIVRYVKRWAFSPVEGGGPVEVIYPFVFEGQPS